MKKQILALVTLIAFSVTPQHLTAQSTGEPQFRKARELLTGPHKDEPEAKRLLLEAVDDSALGDKSRCYVYV